MRRVVGSATTGLLLVLALVLLACESEPPGTAADRPFPAPAPVDPTRFYAGNAWRHLQALVEIGPRQTGTRGAARARRYLETQLRAIGAEVTEIRSPLPGPADSEAGDDEPRTAVHVVGVIPGDSQDRFLLAAAYDTRAIPDLEFVGANASASGPALVLELARALSNRPKPYTLMVVFLDGDELPALRPGAEFPGSRALATRMARDGAFQRIRLAVFFQQVADVDLAIARDLRSHPIYREFFWEAAAVLGRSAYFAPNARVESVDGSHVEFIEQGLRRTVMISDPRFGGDEVPGRYAGRETDSLLRCSPLSLQVVGDVSLEALTRIAQRLTRIDRFHEAPLQEPLGGPDPEP